MSASKKATWSVICRANGCVFLREKLTKRQAEIEATSHLNLCGHGCSVVDMAPKKEGK